MTIATTALPLAAVETVNANEERVRNVYLHLIRRPDGVEEPIRLGTGRNAVVFLATDIKSLNDKAEYRAVKFLRDDPDDQLAYSSSVRFFQEALSLQNKSDNIDSLVRFLGWGAIARDLTRRGPVNSVKEFWWSQYFDTARSVSFEDNNSPALRRIKDRFSLQGPFYCLELCHGTLEHLLERNDRWFDIPVYQFNEGSARALARNAAEIRSDIELFVQRYLQPYDDGEAISLEGLSHMSGYDILNAFKIFPIELTNAAGQTIRDEKGPVTHDPNLIRNHAVLKLFIKIVQSLQYLHQQREAHRDLKPGNIFFRHSNDLPLKVDVKLADLGYVTNSEIIQAGETLKGGSEQAPGSPFYRAPEQADLPIEVRITINSKDPSRVVGKGSKISNIQPNDWVFVADLFEESNNYHLTPSGDEDTNQREELAQRALEQRSEYRDKRFYRIMQATMNERLGTFDLRLEQKVVSAERYDLQAQISKSTGFHTDVYSLGAILYDLISGGRNPEHFYTYCLKVFTDQFGVNRDLIPQSIDEIMEILVPDKTRQERELSNPFKLAGQKPELSNPFALTPEQRALGAGARLGLFSNADVEALITRVFRSANPNLPEAEFRKLFQTLLSAKDFDSLVAAMVGAAYAGLPEDDVKKLLKLLLTAADIDTLVEELLRSAYVDLPEGEIRKKIRDYRFRTFDVVNILLTDKRGVPIPREIISIIVRCMLRDKAQSFCSSDSGWKADGANGRPIVKEIEAEINSLLGGTFRLPDRYFPDRLQDDLLFRLRALSIELDPPADAQPRAAAAARPDPPVARAVAEPRPTDPPVREPQSDNTATATELRDQ